MLDDGFEADLPGARHDASVRSPSASSFSGRRHAGGLLIDGTTRQRYSRVSGVSYALRHRGLEHLPEASGRTLTTEEQAKLQFCRSNDF